MSNFDENSVSTIQFLFRFLIILVNAILSKFYIISKSFNEKVFNLQKISTEQLAAINLLESENELLKLKESKMKLAIENLLVRTQMELDQIESLKEKVEEMEKIENDNESEIENLEKNVTRKDRDIFKTQLKIDFIKLQLQWLPIIDWNNHDLIIFCRWYQ